MLSRQVIFIYLHNILFTHLALATVTEVRFKLTQLLVCVRLMKSRMGDRPRVLQASQCCLRSHNRLVSSALAFHPNPDFEMSSPHRE